MFCLFLGLFKKERHLIQWGILPMGEDKQNEKNCFRTLKGRSSLEKPQGWILSAALYTAQQDSTTDEVPFELSRLFHP